MTTKRSRFPLTKAQGTSFVATVFAPSQDALGENAKEWAKRVLPRVLPGAVVETALSLVSFVGVRYAREFLLRGVLLKKLGRDDLERLYLAQRDEVFAELPLITLEFLSTIRIDEERLFTEENLLLLEAKRHNHIDTMRYIPNERDLSYFLYEEERRRAVSSETLARWGNNLPWRDMDMLAVIDVELVRRKVRRLSQSEIGHRLKVAVKQSPKGNAAKVYLELLLSKAARKGSVRSEIVSALLEMLSPAERTGKIDFTTAQEIFKFYVNNPMIPQEDKQWVISEIAQHCEAFAGHYLRFVEESIKDNPFRTRRA